MADLGTSTGQVPTATSNGATTNLAASRAESFVSAASTPGQTTITPATTISAIAEPVDEPKGWSPPSNGPLKTPIPRPSLASKVPAHTALTGEQETKYMFVLDAVSQWTTVPENTTKTAAELPMEEHERMFLTRECLLRYLRATKWNTLQAIKRLQSTLSWRREYGADTFTPDHISPEAESGKQFLMGFDNDCRPCLYMNPARQNTKVSERQLHQLSYMIDRAIDMMPPGQETTAILVSFKGTATGSVPSLNMGRSALNILQNHNPERLGRAMVRDTPWFVNAFFKVLFPFIDPATKEKIKFNEDLRNYVPAEQLWGPYGGDLKFDYDHSTYWPAFHAEIDKRRKAYRERWVAAGKQIGEYEEYLRGGKQKPLTQVLAESKPSTAQDTGKSAEHLPEQIAALSVEA